MTDDLTAPASPRPSPIPLPPLIATPSTLRPSSKALSSSPVSQLITFHPNTRRTEVSPGFDVWPGDLLLSLTPLFPTLNSALLSTHCAGCWRSSKDIKQMIKDLGLDKSVKRKETLLTCSRCKVFKFCHWRCVTRTMENHYDECRALVESDGEIPSTIVRLLASIVWVRKNKSFNPERDFLPTHPLIPNLPIDDERLSNLTREVCHFIVPLYPHRSERSVKTHLKQYHLTGEADVSILIERILQCVFPLLGESTMSVGLGVSPQLSGVRHSCSPNATVVFPNSPLGKDALRLVAVDSIYSGEQVTISYLDPGIPIHLRTALLATHGFSHACIDCEATKVDSRWCAAHDGCTKEGKVPLVGVTPIPNVGLGAATLGLVNSTKEESRKQTCSGCDELFWADVREIGYAEAMYVLKEEWEAEVEGVALPEEGLSDRYSLLVVELQGLLSKIPSTVYPMPQLIRRLARYQLAIATKNSTPNREHLLAIMNYLTDTYNSMILMNRHSPSVPMLGVLLELMEAMVLLLGVLGRELSSEETEKKSLARFWRIKSDPYEEKKQKFQELLSKARSYLFDAKEDSQTLLIDGTRLGLRVEGLEEDIDGLAEWFESFNKDKPREKK